MSNKISVVGMLCTFLVVWRHSTNMVAFYGGYSEVPEWLSYTEWSFSRITDIAVPMFFIISGYLFLRTDYSNWDSYKKMIIKKSKSLLIPFIIWNVVGFFILLICKVIAPPISFSEFITGILMSQYDGALWYVRNLMLMMALIPLYGFIFHARGGTFVLIPILVFLLWIWWPVDTSITSYEGWLFFCIGGTLQRFTPSLGFYVKRNIALIGVGIWIILCLCYKFGGELMAKTTILFGIATLWFICDWIPSKWKHKILQYSKYSFFIYVTHIFVMKILKVGIAHFFYKDDVVAIAAYMIIPIVCFLSLLAIGIIFSRYAPSMFEIFTGGRGHINNRRI